jgi:hypothetical protein
MLWSDSVTTMRDCATPWPGRRSGRAGWRDIRVMTATPRERRDCKAAQGDRRATVSQRQCSLQEDVRGLTQRSMQRPSSCTSTLCGMTSMMTTAEEHCENLKPRRNGANKKTAGCLHAKCNATFRRRDSEAKRTAQQRAGGCGAATPSRRRRDGEQGGSTTVQ